MAWDAMRRADDILRVLQRATSQRALSVVMGTSSLALREHGVVGGGAHWTACTRTFFALRTGCDPLHERRPVSMSVFPFVLLGISGLPQESVAATVAWDPPGGVPVTVHTSRRADPDAPRFVRGIVSHHGRLFAWSVCFGAPIARDVRAQVGAMDVLRPHHLVAHAVYDISSDPDELRELWSDPSWRRTPLAKLVWEQVRERVVGLPEHTLRAFGAAAHLPLATTPTPPRAPRGARLSDGSAAKRPADESTLAAPRRAAHEETLAVPPTEALLTMTSRTDDDGDDDGDSWCSGPASAVELNSVALRAASFSPPRRASPLKRTFAARRPTGPERRRR